MNIKDLSARRGIFAIPKSDLFGMSLKVWGKVTDGMLICNVDRNPKVWTFLALSKDFKEVKAGQPTPNYKLAMSGGSKNKPLKIKWKKA